MQLRVAASEQGAVLVVAATNHAHQRDVTAQAMVDDGAVAQRQSLVAEVEQPQCIVTMDVDARVLGSVPVSSRTALLRQMSPGKARDAGNGRSLATSRNAAWRHLPRNPKGRACFCAMRRFSSLIWNDQTALLVPCLAQKQAPARSRTKREQTLSPSP